MTELSLLEKHAPHLLPEVFALYLQKKADLGLLDDVEIAKAALEGHGTLGRSRQYFERAIAKRAEASRREGESAAQAFTRCLVDDDEGKLLFKASKIAPAEDAPEDEVEDKPVSRGKAHDELEVMARDHALAHPGMSYAHAYTHLYSRHENAALRARVKAEHAAGIRASRAGGREQAASDRFAAANSEAAYRGAERRPSVSDPTRTPK
jgi:hypothetical protein